MLYIPQPNSSTKKNPETDSIYQSQQQSDYKTHLITELHSYQQKIDAPIQQQYRQEADTQIKKLESLLAQRDDAFSLKEFELKEKELAVKQLKS